MHQRTGVPLFLLYFESIQEPIEIACHSIESLEVWADRLGSVRDRSALLRLRSFFEEGGSSALVFGSPFKKTNDNVLASHLIGISEGYQNRTGIHLITSATEHADLIAVPQAAEWLNPSESLIFYQALLAIIENTPRCFGIIEPPRNLNPVEVCGWVHSLNSSDVAVYYPSLVESDSRGTPTLFSCLPVVAAQFQKTDREKSIAELPTLHFLRGERLPSIRLTPSEQSDLLNAKVNSIIFQPGPDRKARVFGGYTLAPAFHSEFALIPVRRTLKALKDSLESVAEAFVLEPMGVDIELEVENRILGFFAENRSLFDAFTPKPYRVKIKSIHRPQGDGIDIYCEVKLSRCVQELKLEIGVTQT